MNKNVAVAGGGMGGIMVILYIMLYVEELTAGLGELKECVILAVVGIACIFFYFLKDPKTAKQIVENLLRFGQYASKQ